MKRLDYEKGLLSSILDYGLDAFQEDLRTPEAFSEDFMTALKDFEEHFEKYGKLPSRDVCEKIFGYAIPEQGNEPPSFWINLIEKDYFHDQLKDTTLEFMESARADPFGSIAMGSTALNDLAYRLQTVSNTVESAVDYDEHAEYLRSLITNKPMPTFHPMLDDRLSGGFRGGELVTIAARPGEGKTWVLAINAIRAWKAGKRVLIVTTEMSAAEIRLRILCLVLGVSIDLIANRILTPHRNAFKIQKEKWIEAGIYENLMIISKDESKIEDLESEMRVCRPDLVLVDGFYLLNTRQKERDKYVRIGNVINRLKRFARSQQICVVVASQLNRDGATSSKNGKKKQARDLGSLGFSDEIGMISDHVIFLSRDLVEKKAEVMKFEIPKGRRLNDNSDFFIDFNLQWPKKSFFPISKMDYKKRVDIAKGEIEKGESQESQGDYEAMRSQARSFNTQNNFGVNKDKSQSVLEYEGI